MNDFRKDSEVIDWLLSGSRLNRPVKEWERRAIFRKIGRLRADATERENFAFRTTSDAMAAKSEEAARDLRAQADVLEKNAKRLGIKKNQKPTMEGRTMRITRNQIRKIILEAMGSNEFPLSAKAKEWLSWGEGYGLQPEEDNEGQLLFYFNLNDDVDGSIAKEAEQMGGSLESARDGLSGGNVAVYTGEYTGYGETDNYDWITPEQESSLYDAITLTLRLDVTAYLSPNDFQ